MYLLGPRSPLDLSSRSKCIPSWNSLLLRRSVWTTSSFLLCYLRNKALWCFNTPLDGVGDGAFLFSESFWLLCWWWATSARFFMVFRNLPSPIQMNTFQFSFLVAWAAWQVILSSPAVRTCLCSVVRSTCLAGISFGGSFILCSIAAANSKFSSCGDTVDAVAVFAVGVFPVGKWRMLPILHRRGLAVLVWSCTVDRVGVMMTKMILTLKDLSEHVTVDDYPYFPIMVHLQLWFFRESDIADNSVIIDIIECEILFVRTLRLILVLIILYLVVSVLMSFFVTFSSSIKANNPMTIHVFIVSAGVDYIPSARSRNMVTHRFLIYHPIYWTEFFWCQRWQIRIADPPCRCHFFCRCWR